MTILVLSLMNMNMPQKSEMLQEHTTLERNNSCQVAVGKK